MKSCYIVGAGELAPARLTPYDGDLVIAADAGISHLERLGIAPGLILGDFDSLGHVPKGENVEVCPVEKDDTDTLLAVRRALELGYTRILIFGGVGGRLDHTLANIQTLAFANQRGAEAFLFGEGYALTAMSVCTLSFDARYSGDLSIFCHGPEASGVCERGLKYSLDCATLSCDLPLGVSNSFTGESAELCVREGTLIAYWRDNAALPLPERASLSAVPKT